MKIILIQRRDEKSLGWRRAMPPELGTELRPVAGSPFKLPWAMLKVCIAERTRPRAVVFRYLNDYPNIFKTVARFGSELVVLMIAHLIRARVGWICHNVDKESLEYFPRLTRLRRRCIQRAAHEIYVTDDLLVPVAAEALGVENGQIKVAAFGSFTKTQRKDEFDSLPAEARSWLERHKAAGCVVGLWIGSKSEKSRSGLVSLLKTVKDTDRVAAVIIGVPPQWAKVGPTSALNALFLPPQPLHHTEWGQFDFIWKPCDDVSTTVTSIIAAETGVPLVVHRNSHLHTFVEHYGCGVAIDPEFTSPDELRTLLNARASQAARSNVRFSWGRGAEALAALVSDEQEKVH